MIILTKFTLPTAVTLACLSLPSTALAQGDNVVKRPQWPTHSDYIAEQEQPPAQSEPAPAPAPAPAPSPAPTLTENAYVVQLGAFSSRASAENAAVAAGAENTVIMLSRRDGRDFYLLVLGPFPAEEEARQASDAYVQANPDGSVWVRSAAGLELRPR